MKELERFYKIYPPRSLPKHKAPKDEDGREEQSRAITTPYHPSSDILSKSNHILNLPYLSFQHLEILHHKLKISEDLAAINRLKTIVKKYALFPLFSWGFLLLTLHEI
jgi:hypothetical protein